MGAPMSLSATSGHDVLAVAPTSESSLQQVMCMHRYFCGEGRGNVGAPMSLSAAAAHNVLAVAPMSESSLQLSLLSWTDTHGGRCSRCGAYTHGGRRRRRRSLQLVQCLTRGGGPDGNRWRMAGGAHRVCMRTCVRARVRVSRRAEGQDGSFGGKALLQARHTMKPLRRFWRWRGTLAPSCATAYATWRNPVRTKDVWGSPSASKAHETRQKTAELARNRTGRTAAWRVSDLAVTARRTAIALRLPSRPSQISSMIPGVDTTKPALEESRAKAPMVVAPMRAAGETLDIEALLSEHVAATEQPRDDHALRVQADIAAATRGGVWLAPPPLAPAPPAPAPVALATALAKAAADSKLPFSDPRVMVLALTHLTGPKGGIPSLNVAGPWHLPCMLISAAMRCVFSQAKGLCPGLEPCFGQCVD
eukprot:366017-Chlamydomonas_euryale.AAC.5